MNIYDYKVEMANEEMLKLSDYRGKVMVLVTNSQDRRLERMRKYMNFAH